MQTIMGKHWHHLPEHEVLNLLDTNVDRGLDRFEIETRLEPFATNTLTPQKSQGPLRRFLL